MSDFDGTTVTEEADRLATIRSGNDTAGLLRNAARVASGDARLPTATNTSSIGAKGPGKGFPQPPPVGKGKSKGKSKSIPPPPPGPPPGGPNRPGAQPRDIGGNVNVPEILRAPVGVAHLRVYNGVTQTGRASGTLWDGLDPWGDRDALADIPGWYFNVDRLRALWQPAPPVPPRRRRDRPLQNTLGSDRMQNLDVAVRGAGLTADKVRLALDGDSDALTSEQKEALAQRVLPCVAETSGLLNTQVHREGEASLGRTEAIMWAIASIPHGHSRVRVLALEASLTFELDDILRKAQASMDLRERLSESKPLKLLLQAILFIRNVMSQREHTMFPMDNLPETLAWERPRRLNNGGSEHSAWFHEHCPTTLRLVAEAVADLHQYQEHLQFIRKVAVSKCCPMDVVKKVIWSYTDDLNGSILDVFELLRNCDGRYFEEDLCHSVDHFIHRLQNTLNGDIRVIQTHMLSQGPSTLSGSRRSAEAWLGKVEDLSNLIEQSVWALEQSRSTLVTAAQQMCRLTGERVRTNGSTDFEAACRSAYHLRQLGRKIEEELKNVFYRRQKSKTQICRAGSSSTNFARPWMPINTTSMVLSTTRDPEIIRSMRLLVQESSKLGKNRSENDNSAVHLQKVEEDLDDAKEVEHIEVAPKQKFFDLVHTGPEGLYRRDPVTGKWGRRLDGVDGTPECDIKPTTVN